MNKEQIYDEKIHPLIAQIIAICKEHKIAAVASFEIPNDEDEDLVCTTALPNETGKLPEVFAKAVGIIRNGGHQMMALTITKK